MAEAGFYRPQTKVDWGSDQAYSQFKLWKKEVERIINGPLAEQADSVRLNHVYIWAGAQAENLVEARVNEDPTIKVEKPEELLELLGKCLTHSTFNILPRCQRRFL